MYLKKKKKKVHQENCGLRFIYLNIWDNLSHWSHDTEDKMLTFNIAGICAFSPDTSAGERDSMLICNEQCTSWLNYLLKPNTQENPAS